MENKIKTHKQELIYREMLLRTKPLLSPEFIDDISFDAPKDKVTQSVRNMIFDIEKILVDYSERISNLTYDKN